MPLSVDHPSGRLAQVAGAITASWGLLLMVLGFYEISWSPEAAAVPAHSMPWGRLVQVLINATWIGFGAAVIWRQRFSTFLLFFVHLSASVLMATFALLPGRWQAGLGVAGWMLYVAVPALCALLLVSDVWRRWRKPMED